MEMKKYFTPHQLQNLFQIVKDQDCYKAVKNLFTQFNVPQSVQTTINNTGSQFPKSMIEKALAKLIDEKYIIFLQVGKSGKLYVLTQEEIDKLEKDNKEKQEQINKLQGEIQQQNQQLAELQNNLTLEELQKQLDQLKSENSKLDEQLGQYDNVELHDQQFYSDQVKQLKTVFKSRKEIYENITDLLDKISEGTEIDVKELKQRMDLAEMQKPITPEILKQQ